MTNKNLRQELIKQTATLATAGFGLVAALAWNEAIQTFIREYVNRYIASGTGVASKFIYAVIITAIAVFVTYQLTKLTREDEKKD